MRDFLHAVKSLLFIGLGIAGLVWLYVERNTELARRDQVTNGRRTKGNILEVYREGESSQYCLVDYSFNDGNGTIYAIHKRKVPEPPGIWKGDSIDVWYHPAQPDICVAEPELRHDAAVRPWGAAILCLISILFGLSMIVVNARRPK